MDQGSHLSRAGRKHSLCGILDLGRISTVRRVPAILLLAFFSFSLMPPTVFLSDAESKLPSCCRRSGKHRCAMVGDQAGPSSGPTVQAGRCDFFAGALAAPVAPAVVLPKISQTVFVPIVNCRTPRARRESLCHSWFSPADQKRGPPSFLS